MVRDIALDPNMPDVLRTIFFDEASVAVAGDGGTHYVALCRL